jgi:hypothetical protein
MPRINFTFSGWVRADIDQAHDIDGKDIDVSEMCGAVLAEKLETGELFIVLGDHLYAGESEIVMEDFEEGV